MDLILIRHAQAEPDLANDAERALTPEGTKKFKRVSKGINSLLKAKLGITLCSSPLTRARQTAELLAAELELSEIEIVDGLAGEAALEDVLNEYLKRPSLDCLILVGHQPYLTNWSVDLCGLPLPFKKGAAACFRLNDSLPGNIELRWFIQPGVWPK